MKTLYEGILADMEDTLDRGAYDVILSQLFCNDIQQRRKAFDDLRIMVEAYHPKQHKTTAKMKNSDSYFVEFVWPLGIQNGNVITMLNWITYIQICKRTGLDYRTTCIEASDNKFSKKTEVYELNWRYTQANFNPKASNSKLYEVPEELNDLFRRIQMEAYNHR